jgi:hypothetical protein
MECPLPVSSGSFLAAHRLKQHGDFIRAIRYSPSSQLATGSPNSGLSRLLTVSRWFESGPGSQIKSRSYMTLPDRRQAHKPVRGSIQGSYQRISIQAAIADPLTGIFGENTSRYHRYLSAGNLDHGGLSLGLHHSPVLQEAVRVCG